MTLALDFSPIRPLVLIGAGKMGGALLQGWIDQGLNPRAVVVIDPSPSAESAAMLAAAGLEALDEPPSGVARVMVVAVKPQVIADVLPDLRGLVGNETVVISIAAGTPIKALKAGLGDAAIIRAMPNTPASVGRGITVAIATPEVDEAGGALATELFEAVGDVLWVDDEKMIDAATAVSGSGPAYVFHMVEALTDAAVSLGFSDEQAERLARSTVTGAAELLYQTDTAAGTLRENVTSPNGTTEAALAVLMGRTGMKPLMKRAVAAARKRARELAK